jgi:hypothetical protein
MRRHGYGGNRVTIDWVFPRRVALVVLAAAAAAYPVMRLGGGDILLAAAAGCLLSTLNALAGFVTIEIAFGKSYTAFLKAVLGGMAVRMLLALGALMILIAVYHLHTVALTVSLLGFYMIYLVLEILYLQKKVMVKNQE